MPTKTLYVKDADQPLFQRAQEEFGESISALFADFLRERVAKSTPEERRMLDLLNRIQQQRETLKSEAALPAFVDAEFDAAEAHTRRALESLHAGEVKHAKIFWYAANTYYEWADRDLKRTREMIEKIDAMLKS